MNQKLQKKNKAQGQMASRVNLIKYLKNNYQSFSNSSEKNRRGGSTSKHNFQGQYYHDTKTRQGHYKKRKLQVNIPIEGFPRGSVEKNLLANAEDGSVPGMGRSCGKGNSNPFQYPCLENIMDRGAWWVIYSPWHHKSQT